MEEITTITRIIIRHYRTLERQPWNCSDTVLAHFISKEDARDTLRTIVGESATVTIMEGIEFYNSPSYPKREYILDTVELW